MSPETERYRRLVARAIRVTGLDLSELAVLTEVGSGPFALTPVIALAAGAARVFAWTRDSRFGSGEENIAACGELMEAFGLRGDRMVFADGERPGEHVESCDLITNLGFVRPLGETLLRHADPARTVIALMSESWELRRQDVDSDYCRDRGFRVAGTWENHPDLRIFSGCGPLAIKLALEAGFEVYQNRIAVWSSDDFGEIVADAFERFGAERVMKTTDVEALRAKLEDLDFVFFCNYREQRPLVAEDAAAVLTADAIRERNPGLGLVHLYGAIDAPRLLELGLRVHPASPGVASRMTATLAHLGPKPLIDLHSAGLAVGACLRRGVPCEFAQDLRVGRTH